MMDWAKAPLDRNQVTLFAPTLDDSVSADHPVRLFDDVMRTVDFLSWENNYNRTVGQPPIHPRFLASIILYGMTLGIRASRKLEDMTINRMDAIWLLDGRQPDHATICKFRTQFETPLKELFKQIGRLAITMGMVSLNQVTLDGTAIRANNSREKTARRATLEEKIKSLDDQIDAAMQQAVTADQADDQMYGETSPVKLPKDLADLKKRQAKLAEAIKQLAEIEKNRAAHGERKDVSKLGPAVPLTDPDSRVLPNKEGGFAPNYTGVLAVDSDHGIIVDVQILSGNDEPSTVLPAVENIQELLGEKPKQIAADSGFNTGVNLTGLEAQNVQPLMPPKQEFDSNPALREDLSQPVPPEQHAQLPINPQNKNLDKSGFIYDAKNDQYICPMSNVLLHIGGKKYNRHGVTGIYEMYEAPESACADCPLKKQCLQKDTTVRHIYRDEHEAAREKMAAYMKTEKGKAEYRRRAWSAETPFAVMKFILNFRRFLLRGVKKVTMEFTWTAIACNLKKIVRFRATEMAKMA